MVDRRNSDHRRRDGKESITPYYLRIEPGDQVAVPKKYHALVNASATVYDQMRACFSETSFNGFRRSTYHFKPGEHEQYAQSGLHILEWLRSVGAKAELEECLVRHITLAVLADLMGFLFESMHSMKYGRPSVSFSLLRKPFVDSLAILEEILLDPEDFVNRFFHNGELSAYDSSKRKGHSQDRIVAVCKRLRLGSLFVSDVVYKMRYDKATGVCVDRYANQALHIVTDDRRYRTSKASLNFVFSDDDDRLNYFKDYYFVVPFLLAYMAEVVDTILERHVVAAELMTIRRLQRAMVIDLWAAHSIHGKKRKQKSLLPNISKHVVANCERCGKANTISKADCVFIIEHDYWICSGCFENLLHQKAAAENIERFVSAFKPN